MAFNYMCTKFSIIWSMDNWKKNNSKKSIENYNFQFPMWCILLFYNSQPYIVDPYIAAYFGYLMIHNYY